MQTFAKHKHPILSLFPDEMMKFDHINQKRWLTTTLHFLALDLSIFFFKLDLSNRFFTLVCKLYRHYIFLYFQIV